MEARGKMNKPGAIIIGCQRCGTTSLWNYLSEHPDILPCDVKETYYFNRYYNKGKEWYESHFPAATKEGQIALEATPFYFYHEPTAKRIYDTYGNDIKFIVMMRNPIERAYSHFKLNMKRKKAGDRVKHELLTAFEDGLQMEHIRLKDKGPDTYEQFMFSYINKGEYAKQVQRWFEIFKPENFLFVKSESMFDNTQRVYSAIVKFLGLEKHKLRKKLAYNSTKKGRMDPKTRKLLSDHFKPHNKELYKILGIDFGWC